MASTLANYRTCWSAGVILLFGFLLGTSAALASSQTQAASGRFDNEHIQAGSPETHFNDASTCRSIVPDGPSIGKPRTVEMRDLLRLRDFGSFESFEAAPPGFSVSPDGDRLAIQVRQADPVRNTYCQGLLIFRLSAPTAAPVILDQGGEFARDSFDLYGMNGFPAGTPLPLTPKWSPDGNSIAFMKRENAVTRLFVVSIKGGAARPITDAAADVVDFKWADNAILEFSRNEALQSARADIRAEAQRGYLYDERFWMVAELEPFPRGTLKNSVRRVEILTDGTIREIAVQLLTRAASGAYIDTQPIYGGNTMLRASIDGNDIVCNDPACSAVTGAWLLPRSSIVIFLRREGFANSRTAIYRWDVSGGRTKKLTVVDDAISGCIAVHRLICGRETSLGPRDIVDIDPATGSIRALIDMNPEWRNLKHGEAVRIYWTNKDGTQIFGDLVLPPAAKRGQKLPLVVVQYNSRGFLRGGTGDEYPIQAIAAQGFAVLSFNRPPSYRYLMMRSGQNFSLKEIMSQWKDRESVHDALLKGIDQVASLYPIDMSHLAITGLSDGGSTATYALIHSRLFSLALLSTCCEDPTILEDTVGPAYVEFLKQNGYPVPATDHEDSWRRVSLAMNAERICARVVIQTADREARAALASVAALRAHGRDVSMYIYPDEYHVKWQPAHRSAVYDRTLSELNRWKHGTEQLCEK